MSAAQKTKTLNKKKIKNKKTLLFPPFNIAFLLKLSQVQTKSHEFI